LDIFVFEIVNPSFYTKTDNMKLSLVLLSVVGIAVAVPQGCSSSAWEKLHEGHGHNINNGHVGSMNLGLKLPGGTGCYKGQKVEGGRGGFGKSSK